MAEEMETYPVTIIEDRYTGTYSGALWTAFNLYDDEIPSAVSGDDVSCREFWDFVKKFNVIVGYGRTPDEAFKDLARKKEDMKWKGDNYELVTAETFAREMGRASITSALEWISLYQRLNEMGYAICKKNWKGEPMAEYITWEAYKSMVTPSYTSLLKRTNILCPKCTKPLMKDESIVLTTYPAQYRYFCEDCGWQGTGR